MHTTKEVRKIARGKKGVSKKKPITQKDADWTARYFGKERLDLLMLRLANRERQTKWDPHQKLTLEFRGLELGGEAGEALNAVKKIAREGGARELVIDPDMVADFTALPFEDGRFALVVFDPPHLVRNGRRGWLAKKYGKLEGDWREDLRKGFAECFRVLKRHGALVFKWNEFDVPVSEVLALTPVKPLFGNRCGKAAKSHWIVFLKEAAV